ncbi:MAG: hypothetical protein U5K84_09440 [Alkalibacterium sp.]|nr:hypothetical protein [Alkalibacterium sp.]
MKSKNKKQSKLTLTFIGIFTYMITKELFTLMGVDLTRPLIDSLEVVFG